MESPSVTLKANVGRIHPEALKYCGNSDLATAWILSSTSVLYEVSVFGIANPM
jgi:hypothetical protein